MGPTGPSDGDPSRLCCGFISLLCFTAGILCLRIHLSALMTKWADVNGLIGTYDRKAVASCVF